jgi:hypothetical protein
MGGVTRGCEKYNGHVTGIIHEKFCVDFGKKYSQMKIFIIKIKPQ